MDYDKILSIKNFSGLSDRQFAISIDMTGEGFSSMMKNKSLKVKTLEKICEVYKKPLSYFSDNIDQKNSSHQIPIEELQAVEKSGKKYCKGCEELKKLNKLQQDVIDSKEKNLEDLRHHIRTLENKSEVNLANTGSQ